MSDYQAKYREEKKKYDNLIKMQQSMISQTEEYVSAFHSLRQGLSTDGQSYDPNEDISTQEAHQIVQKTIQLLGKKCECDRWKHLYQQESTQSAQLSQEKEVLMQKISLKEKEEELDRIQVHKLLQDYIELYKKEVVKEREKVVQKNEPKQKRSRSRGNSQAEKKNKGEEKEEKPWKGVLDRVEASQLGLRRQIEELRSKVIELEQTVSLYRKRERKHLLSGGQLLD